MQLFGIVVIWFYYFRIEQNDRLYIAKELDGFMDHEPIKIINLITNILFNGLKWRARHHTPA